MLESDVNIALNISAPHEETMMDERACFIYLPLVLVCNIKQVHDI